MRGCIENETCRKTFRVLMRLCHNSCWRSDPLAVTPVLDPRVRRRAGELQTSLSLSPVPSVRYGFYLRAVATFRALPLRTRRHGGTAAERVGS